MGITIDLAKKAEQVTICLAKKGINVAPVMRVGAALDISGSMDGIINGGGLQRALDQLLGIAIKFDDNGEIDVWKFDNDSDYVGTCTPDDFGDYVKKKGIKARGGTAYTPVINDIARFMFQPAKTETKKVGGFLGFGGKTVTSTVPGTGNTDPVLILFITDGEPYHDVESRIYNALNALKDRPIYFQMVGVGSADFSVLERLAAKLGNVGFVNLSGFDLTDAQVYEQLISDELVSFIGQFPAAAASASA